MPLVDHGTITPANGPADSTRGNHILQGHANVLDESARAAVVIAAADLGRAVRQTAGLLPGYYISIATGTGLDKWELIGNALSYKLISDSIGANQNNYAPTGWEFATHLRLTATGANRDITGFVAVADSETFVKHIVNIADFAVTLTHDDALSTAANRILLPGDLDFSIGPNEAASLFYDETSTRWRLQ